LTAAVVTQLGWCAGHESGRVIHLRDAVEINRAVVLLSDLLPAEAPVAIRNASATIELCRAPQPGSVRTLHAEQILAAIKTHFDPPPDLVIPPTVLIRSTGWPISEAGVRDAISEFLQKNGSGARLPEITRLYLPEHLAATQESFQLRVTHMEWNAREHAIAVRLRCLNRRSCGSFLARAVLPKSEDWPHRLLQAISSSSTRPPNGPALAGRPLIARGKTATLILEEANMRISVPVTCLEPGLLHQRIRVFDRQSRRVFLADIVGDHLLHASL
jgi:hypothetical protein